MANQALRNGKSPGSPSSRQPKSRTKVKGAGNAGLVHSADPEVPKKAWGQVLSSFFDRFWFYIRIHLLAIKWTLIQLFSRHCYFNPAKHSLHEAELAIVTGGASGIGAEIVRKLYACNLHVIIACNDLPAAQKLKEEIEGNQDERSYGGIELGYLELTSFECIREFVENVQRRNFRLKFLINNAGVMFCPYSLTEDGFETTVQVNYLGPFLLTSLLMPLLKNGGTGLYPSRVINVSSVVHFASTGIDFDKDFVQKNEYRAYVNSKLMQVACTNYMNKRLGIDNVIFSSAHPGIVNTDLYKNVFYFNWIRPIMRILYHTPSQGADGIAHATLSEDMNRGGTFSGNCQVLSPHPSCDDEGVQKKLWMISCQLTKTASGPRTSERIANNLRLRY